MNKTPDKRQDVFSLNEQELLANSSGFLENKLGAVGAILSLRCYLSRHSTYLYFEKTRYIFKICYDDALKILYFILLHIVNGIWQFKKYQKFIAQKRQIYNLFYFYFLFYILISLVAQMKLWIHSWHVSDVFRWISLFVCELTKPNQTQLDQTQFD